MYFDHLLGAVCTLKLVEILFCHFQLFLLILYVFCLKTRKDSVFGFSLKLGDTQMLVDSMRGTPIFPSLVKFFIFLSIFGLFFYF